MMTTKHTGGSAFPVWELNGSGKAEMTDFGMSLRDYFAAKAMQGLLAMEANPRFGVDIDPYWQHGRDDLMAKCAYGLADAMLKAREES